MNENQTLTPNVDVQYSQDEDIYYLQKYVGCGETVVSKTNYNTKKAAIDDYFSGEVVWV